jgi:hypothetical protein
MKFSQQRSSAWFEPLFIQKLREMNHFLKMFTDLVDAISRLIDRGTLRILELWPSGAA